MNGADEAPKGDGVGDVPSSPVVEGALAASVNPLSGSIPVSVIFPEDLKVELVQLTSFAQYELWAFITSLMIGVGTSFTTVWVSSTSNQGDLLMAVSIVADSLAALSLVLTLLQRNKIVSKKRAVIFDATPRRVVEGDG